MDFIKFLTDNAVVLVFAVIGFITTWVRFQMAVENLTKRVDKTETCIKEVETNLQNMQVVKQDIVVIRNDIEWIKLAVDDIKKKLENL